jgi:hypothetical protein
MKSKQSIKIAANKIGKRTYTLKELAQRDFLIIPKGSSEEHAPAFNLVTIQEDLLEDDVNQLRDTDKQALPEEGLADKKKSNLAKNITPAIDLVNHLIQKEIGKIAKVLELEEPELQAWIDLQVMVPKQTLLALLRIAKDHNLDPLKDEVALALYDESRWQAYITVEGYCKILNSHPAFNGITFSQSEEDSNEVPTWMECSIYRKDRILPIVVREYFEEVKGEQANWKKMPRRMLRHRTMQQCAKLAME